MIDRINFNINNSYIGYGSDSTPYGRTKAVDKTTALPDKKGSTNTSQESSHSQTNEKSTESSSAQDKKADGTPLSQGEQVELTKLRSIDTQVRTHEMAHIAAGGQYITHGAVFQYKQGPDGGYYAVGGEVGIDVSKVPNDPQATISKMQQVRRAALAPADPSSQDLSVAAKASQVESSARTEMQILKTESVKQDSNVLAAYEKSKPNSSPGTSNSISAYQNTSKSDQTGSIINIVS